MDCGATSGATNKVGGDIYVQTGLGTGNSKPGRVDIQADAQGTASGTTDHARVTRIGINGTASLTHLTATSVVTIPLATLQMAGGTLLVSVEATDGTDVISFTGGCHYSAVNKSATYRGTVQSILSAVSYSDSGDTLTVGFSFNVDQIATVNMTGAAGGTAYTVGDILTLATPTGGSAGTVTVSTVSAGVVTAVTLRTIGSFYTTGLKSTTGGTGTLCTVNVATLVANGTNQVALRVTPILTGMTATTFRATFTVISNAQQDITI